MNKMRAVLALSLLSLFAAGCDVMDNPVSLGPAVYGTVVEAGTSTPVDSATVTIAGRQATTAANGNYYIADVPQGTHVLQVTKTGFATYSAEVTVDNSLVQKNVQLAK